jgi:hypothetical protein
VFDSKIYLAHRLAFLYMIGRWPEADTDHVNLNRSDCRWSNLREATRAQNLQNKGRIKTNTSGFPGVHFYKRTNNWAVKIEVNGKKIQIYGFDTIEAAVQARSELVKKYHGEFARLS